MRKCSLSRIDDIFAELSKTNKLIVPVKCENGTYFKEWEKGQKFSYDENTQRSAKDFFFAQYEELMTFKHEGNKLSVFDTKKEACDLILFGIRACDAKSFEILDRVFLSEPVDTCYKARRESATIVTLACNEVQSSCFCTSFGIHPEEAEGDVSAWIVGEHIFFEANSDKGRAFLEKTNFLTLEDDGTAIKAEKEKIRKKLEALPLYTLDTSAFGAGKTNKFFDSDIWEKYSDACLSCGSCTYNCPTCMCYDIKDTNLDGEIIRYRCWDSCMYSEFTKMAHSNNRNKKSECFRQRFMHKLVYYPDNNDGMFSCVGCGRCINKCPVSMNIVKVMKALGEENGK